MRISGTVWGDGTTSGRSCPGDGDDAADGRRDRDPNIVAPRSRLTPRGASTAPPSSRARSARAAHPKSHTRQIAALSRRVAATRKPPACRAAPEPEQDELIELTSRAEKKQDQRDGPRIATPAGAARDQSGGGRGETQDERHERAHERNPRAGGPIASRSQPATPRPTAPRRDIEAGRGRRRRSKGDSRSAGPALSQGQSDVWREGKRRRRIDGTDIAGDGTPSASVGASAAPRAPARCGSSQPARFRSGVVVRVLRTRAQRPVELDRRSSWDRRGAAVATGGTEISLVPWREQFALVRCDSISTSSPLRERIRWLGTVLRRSRSGRIRRKKNTGVKGMTAPRPGTAQRDLTACWRSRRPNTRSPPEEHAVEATA